MTQPPALLRPASLHIDGIDVALRPSHAGRFILRVGRGTGEARLSMPARATRAEAERFLRAHRDWLKARIAAAPGPAPFAPGSLVPLRGVPHLLRLDPFRRKGPVLAARETLHVPGPPEGFAEVLGDWLKAEARKDLAEAVGRHARALGVAPGRITLRDPRTRWGSCAAKGGLSFSWRLILAPPEILDYVAAHECAHLVEFDHGPGFWALVRRLRPDHERAEDWLRAQGADLQRYGRTPGA
ncbi:M48 family metallopeptidase [Neomegalonema perideroedes]|uniref:M48 family metallopeptidase n=1 Tax=Neomegalonema perideroedes TaxID=217219 RepID=UPI00035D39DD|nr:SprT family zinc-dependent metalloprotease [Neomegalonema perideroedes]